MRPLAHRRAFRLLTGLLGLGGFAAVSVTNIPTSYAAVALGTQAIGTNADTDSAGSAESFQAVAAASGSVASLTLYIDSPSKSTKVIVGLYSNNSGQPGTLLTQGTISSPIGGAWNTIAVPAVTITSGTVYWFSLLSPTGSGTVAFRDTPRSGGTLSENSSAGNLSALPGTWSAGAKDSNSPVSAYATLATSGGPVLTVTPTAVSMGAQVGGGNPSPASVSVANTGSGSLSFTAASDSQWLTVTPTGGTAPQTLTLSASDSGLSAGSYTGHVTVTASGAQGSPQVVTVTLNLTTPPPPGAGDWPTIEHDPGRSGTATDETQIGTANASSLKQAWSTALDGKVTAQPLYLSGVPVNGANHNVVIAATNQNTLYALDADSGAVLWSNHLAAAPASCGIPGGFGITGAPVVDRASGRIYAVTDDGYLRTVSLADGSAAAPALSIISAPATNNVWGGLNLVNGNLYIPTGSNGCDTAPWQGGIYQVNVGGSAPQLLKHWITVPTLPANEAGGGIWGYGGVSVDTSTGHVYAASADDATNLTGDEGYTPYSGSLLALDSNVNLLGWYQPPQPPNYNCGSSPPCDQDFSATPLVFKPPGCPAMLAAGNKNGDLYVTSESNLEADGGTDGSHVQVLILNQTIDDLGLGGLFGTPVYDPTTNLVYVVDTGPGINGIAGGLVALAVQPDCSLKYAWSQTVGTAKSNSPNSTPTLANGVVYVGVNDGSVRAYDASSGTSLWNSGSVGSAVYAAPIVANGKVIAGSWNSYTASAAGTITAWAPSSALGFAVNPTSLAFSATAGGPNPPPQNVSLTNSGSSSLTYTASSSASWLSAQPSSGSVPNTLSVQPQVSSLSAGTYQGQITVVPSQGSAAVVSVTLTVNPAPTVPGAPTGVTAAPGNAAASVSWTAPANGGSPISSYTVTPYIGSTAQPATSVTGNPPATSTTVGGLTNGTAYTFTVTATNGIGTGPPSSPSNAVTPSATSAAPVVDVSTSVNGTGTTATTPAFSTARSNDLLVAFVATDGPSGGGQTATVSGAGLTWSLAVRSNAQLGTSEIWTADAPSPLTNATVTSTESKAGYHQALTVSAFQGAAAVPGNTLAANAASGAPTVNLSTSKPNSLAYAVGNDWDKAVARTVGSGQSLVSQDVDTSAGDTYWVQRITQPVPTPGPATLNDTAPTTDRWNLAAIEIPAAGSSTDTTPPTVQITAPAAGSQVTGTVSVTATASDNVGVTGVQFLLDGNDLGPVVTTSPYTVSWNTATVGNGSHLLSAQAYDAAGNVGTATAVGVTVSNQVATAPTIDPSTPPPTAVASNVAGATSPAFSPPAGTVLYAVFSLESDSYKTGQATTVTSVTNTGSPLTWNLLGRDNTFNGSVGGFLEVWWAYNPSAQTGVTATATFSKNTETAPAPVGDFQVLVLDHAASNQSPAAWSANNLLTTTNNSPTVAVTTTASNSEVLGVFENWNNGQTPVAGTGQSIQSVVLNTTDVDAYWAQSQNNPTASAGTNVVMNATDPGPATQWRALAWEVLAG